MSIRIPTLIVISGPTAVGKTSVAIALAKKFNTEVVSADSRQFYKEIPIGTASPSLEEMDGIKHYCIGHLSVVDSCNMYSYERTTLDIINNIFAKNDYCIVCGGSGMYIDALCNGIDDMPDIAPEIRNFVMELYNTHGLEHMQIMLQTLDNKYYKEVDLNNHVRILRAIEMCLQTDKPYSESLSHSKKERPFRILKIGLDLPRAELYDRINKRVDIMIEQGLEAEVKAMIPFKDKTALKTVGYRELFAYFNGEDTFEGAIDKIKQNSRNYAKRQISWIQRDGEYTIFSPFEVEKICEWIEKSV